MKKQFIGLIIIFFSCSYQSMAKVNFNEFFNQNALRVDFTLAGNSQTQSCYLDQIKREPFWGGRQNNLDTTLNLGEYRIDVRDAKSGELIYSEGFCTLFEEWQTTDEAVKMKRSFTNSVQVPFPKNKVELVILHRTQSFFTDSLFTLVLDPESQLILESSLPLAETDILLKNGDPEKCIDIAIIAEGYTIEEQALFFKEARKISKGLFSSSVFDKHKDKLNIYAIAAPSQQSGVDNPHQQKWSNSALNSSFNTFYSDRYLTTSDIRTVRDYAALVPYDQIYILANTDKYGGGGIYNFYSICASRGRAESEVFIHEFGHAFAGLGDEYYSSDVSYSDFYDLELEPWQPNLTTLVNFNSKWKDLIDENTPVPTPSERKYRKKTGLFEGGGYSAKNIYRPALDCRMKTNEANDFCEVCQAAIERTILFLTE